MTKHQPPSRFIVLIIAGLFISEVISMGTIALFDSISYITLTILDASLLILLATPLLYYFSLRPLLKVIAEREAEIVQRQIIERLLRTQTTALETAANGVIITDKNGKIIWANQAFARMSGYSVEEVLGKLPSLLNSGVQSADFYNNLWETILSGRVWNGEITNRRKDGNHYVGEQTISPVFNSDGEIESFIAIQQDITERKLAETALRKSEEKFRTLLDWTYDWEIWTDPHDKVMYNSPSCERITGFHPDDFIATPDLLKEMVHPEDRAIFDEHTLRTHDESAGSITLEYRIIARDGSVRWIGHNCRPLFGADGRYLGRRVSNRDVTEQKQSQDEIRESAQKEKSLTQEIHSLQINIARDLHDTVGQNISYLRLNLDHLSGLDLQTGVDIKSEIKSMAKVANESYDLIRGTLSVLQSENVADLFRIFSRYVRQVEERSKIKIDFASDGEDRVLSANQMRQLFYILREALSNIEKHANATRVFIKLIWAKESLTLVVFDNGCGIESINTQFDSHYGLKFMRERTELLNGTISIDSEVGAGTNITISVPYE